MGGQVISVVESDNKLDLRMTYNKLGNQSSHLTMVRQLKVVHW